jgi:hypothetical protein
LQTEPHAREAVVVELADWQAAKSAARYGYCPHCKRGPFTLKSSTHGLPVHGPAYDRCRGSHGLPLQEATQ